MSLEQLEYVRALAATFVVVGGAASVAAGGMVFVWKAIQWATVQVERAKAVNKLIVEVPLLAAGLTRVTEALTALADRFDRYVAAEDVRSQTARTVAVVSEKAAVGEREKQGDERIRSGGTR